MRKESTEFILKVQGSGTNVFVNLPKELRTPFDIQKGDELIAVVDFHKGTITIVEKRRPEK